MKKIPEDRVRGAVAEQGGSFTTPQQQRRLAHIELSLGRVRQLHRRHQAVRMARTAVLQEYRVTQLQLEAVADLMTTLEAVQVEITVALVVADNAQRTPPVRVLLDKETLEQKAHVPVAEAAERMILAAARA